LPIYDKPMVHYPIAPHLNAGLRQILIITTREDQRSFVRLLGDGAALGISFDYVIQERPEGLAQAFLLGEDFLAGDSAALVQGTTYSMALWRTQLWIDDGALRALAEPLVNLSWVKWLSALGLTG
jgi:dTDP-glucose pyrophosphorylase